MSNWRCNVLLSNQIPFERSLGCQSERCESYLLFHLCFKGRKEYYNYDTNVSLFIAYKMDTNVFNLGSSSGMEIVSRTIYSSQHSLQVTPNCAESPNLFLHKNSFRVAFPCSITYS